ncbi:MAG: DNA mismatch repair protein MutL, partial [Oscillospiraceae bacterium]|nr:DNA mismatch repair protein MutL [Oscillospiraceae bacterium]
SASAPAFRTRIPAVSVGELGGRARVADYVRREEAPKPFPASAPIVPAALAPVEAPRPITAEPAPEPEQVTMIPETVIPWRIAGEVLDTYIVCEDAEKNVWLIDKHAAHERVNFDRFKAQHEPIMSQTLLTPLVAQLGAAEYAAVAERFDALRAFGFTCEDFGGNAVLIRDIPADIDEGDAVATLEEIAGDLARGKSADPAAARDALLATLACKAAIKGGWKSDERELRALVDKVQSGEVEYCPHGRPVKVKLTQRDLEKMFKRIV